MPRAVDWRGWPTLRVGIFTMFLPIKNPVFWWLFDTDFDILLVAGGRNFFVFLLNLHTNWLWEILAGFTINKVVRLYNSAYWDASSGLLILPWYSPCLTCLTFFPFEARFTYWPNDHIHTSWHLFFQGVQPKQRGSFRESRVVHNRSSWNCMSKTCQSKLGTQNKDRYWNNQRTVMAWYFRIDWCWC